MGGGAQNDAPRFENCFGRSCTSLEDMVGKVKVYIDARI